MFRQQQLATSTTNIGAAHHKLEERGPVVEEPVIGVSPPVPVAMGRGMIAKLKSMVLNVPTTRLPESQALAPKAGASPKEFKPLLEQQEKPPVVKKGTIGNRLVFVDLFCSSYLDIFIFLLSRCEVVANYVRLNIDPDKGIFEYEVRFDPSIDGRDMRVKLLNQHKETLGPSRTFDGVTLYLPHQMPDRVFFALNLFFKNLVTFKYLYYLQVTVWKSTHPVTNESVSIKIHLRQKRRAADSIHFYNVLIRKIARILGMVQMNRNYFNPHSPIFMPVEK